MSGRMTDVEWRQQARWAKSPAAKLYAEAERARASEERLARALRSAEMVGEPGNWCGHLPRERCAKCAAIAAAILARGFTRAHLAEQAQALRVAIAEHESRADMLDGLGFHSDAREHRLRACIHAGNLRTVEKWLYEAEPEEVASC